MSENFSETLATTVGSSVGVESKKRIKLLIVGIITAIVFVFAGAGGAIYAHYSGSTEATPAPTTPQPTTPEPEPEPEPTETVDPYEGKELNILLLGSDSRSTQGNPSKWIPADARTDTIMIMQISGDRQHVTVMSIPRNTAAVIAGYGDRTLVNAAYERGGFQTTKDTIQNLTGIRIDHILMCDFVSFSRLVDSIGGITMTTVKDGTRTYNGADALWFVRERKTLPRDDIDRTRHHQTFIKAVFKKVFSPEVLASPEKLTQVYNSLRPYVAADDAFTVETAVEIASAMAGIPDENMTFLTMPYADTTTDANGLYILNIDEGRARPLFEAFQTGHAFEQVAQGGYFTLDSEPVN